MTHTRWMSRSVLAIGLLAAHALAWADPKGPSELRFGEVRISDLPGQDVMRLPNCEGTWNEPVQRLIIEVRGADAYVYDIALRDEHGDTRVVSVRDTLKARQLAHFVEVGAPMCVTHLEFLPDPDIPQRSARNQPVVTVTGEVALVDVAPTSGG